MRQYGLTVERRADGFHVVDDGEAIAGPFKSERQAWAWSARQDRDAQQAAIRRSRRRRSRAR